MSVAAAKAKRGLLLTEALAIARYHIMGIAVAASLAFGWLISGRHLWAISAVVALDWLLINLLNRVTDISEDLANNIAGTARVASWARAINVGACALLAASFIVTHLVWPALTPYRIAVQGLGMAYNYRIVPTPRGWSRFKELYFFKNFASSVLFVLTCVGYPLAVTDAPRLPSATLLALVAFFVLFELTYEILYDLRDLEGDRREGVPTYPAVHGPERARQIIDGLLLASGLTLAASFAVGIVGVREALMLVALLVQYLFYRPRFRRGLTAHDCIVATHLGTLMLAIYLVGAEIWINLGLPANVWL